MFPAARGTMRPRGLRCAYSFFRLTRRTLGRGWNEWQGVVSRFHQPQSFRHNPQCDGPLCQPLRGYLTRILGRKLVQVPERERGVTVSPVVDGNVPAGGYDDRLSARRGFRRFEQGAEKV